MRFVRYLQHWLSGTGAPLAVTDFVPLIEILRETPSFRAGRKGGGPCGATAEPSGGVEAPAFRPGRTSTAPALTFDFQQDYLDLDDVRYYALRIPYSIIHELHQREFTALKQPADELAVNDTVEAVGFDFIRTPELEYECGVNQRNGELLPEVFIRIET